MMIKITQAYEILSDPEKRAEYEQLLKHGAKHIRHNASVPSQFAPQ